ncbi:hypothetical protein DRW03_30520 [Corallococcus sp. H22C18031201]|nr:hypothetical protein DRW03_30520 [Corallococcus sp. H22C18031201]
MKRGWRATHALVMASAMWLAGCGSSGGHPAQGADDASTDPTGEPGPPDSGTDLGDGGDSIPDAGDDAGTPDAGPPDAGTDAGTPDAGPPDVVLTLPTTPGWQFYGPQQGGPRFVFAVSSDQGGNIWVAGGEEGLFLLKRGETTLRHFTMADGLHPYGLMRDGKGGPPPGDKYLKVISVAGGKSGTVFVGYEGKPVAKGKPTCEDEWDQADNEGRPPDASVYKSGDADKVSLQQDGTLRVVHYDIHTGPNRIAVEMRGREKLCTIYRIAYDPKTSSVWFGGNHGFARGDAEFDGHVPSWCFDPRPYTQPGFRWDYVCTGVLEHVHPAINGSTANGGDVLLTDRYFGVAITANSDVFFGGQIRSTRFYYGSNANNYWEAQKQTENAPYVSNRIDIWQDHVQGESWPYPTEADRVDDHVSAMSMADNGDVWVASFVHGLARLSPSGQLQGTVTSQLINYTPATRGKPSMAPTSAVAVDPWDGSVWAGGNWWGGITRLKGGSAIPYGDATLGRQFVFGSVADIQMDRSSSNRKVLVGFAGYVGTDGRVVPGALGIYTGE